MTTLLQSLPQKNTKHHSHDDNGLNWPRIVGLSFVISIHAGALLLLLAPVTPPSLEALREDVTRVVIIEPPPPPPPPPPPEPEPEPEPPKPQEVQQPPDPIPEPPPPQPPIVVDDPSPVDILAPPPAPPSAVASVDSVSKNMNKPRYPPQELRRGIEGTVTLLITIGINGEVIKIEIETSSGNRNLDRAARKAAEKWRFNPELRDGQRVVGKVRIDVDFEINR